MCCLHGIWRGCLCAAAWGAEVQAHFGRGQAWRGGGSEVAYACAARLFAAYLLSSPRQQRHSSHPQHQTTCAHPPAVVQSPRPPAPPVGNPFALFCGWSWTYSWPPCMYCVYITHCLDMSVARTEHLSRSGSGWPAWRWVARLAVGGSPGSQRDGGLDLLSQLGGSFNKGCVCRPAGRHHASQPRGGPNLRLPRPRTCTPTQV